MKKLWILFTALALLAVAMPAVAEVTHGLVFYWYGNTDFDSATADTATMLKARVKVAGDVDENNKISTELRWNNGAKIDIGSSDPLYTAGDWNYAGVKVKTFKLDTNLTGALGLNLPVTIKSTVGVWESDFTGWWYATRAGWSFVGGFNEDEQGSGAAQLDIGAGPVNLHYYQNFGAGAESTTMIGADAAFGPAGVWVAFNANDAAGLGDGTLAVEGKYEGKFGDLALSVYPAVTYNLGTSTLGWDAGVKVGFKMLTVAASAGSKDAGAEAFDLLEAEVGAAFGKANLWAALYMSLAAADALQGVDLMASYGFGAATVYAGYIIRPDTATSAIPVDGWEWDSGIGGLYLGVKASL